ncbi:DUF4175 family protein [Namhaeicola litoreus]|uniref:DUF4175 family protein n=1 Tax=Namhaeicola litoreus TaxID=1052145 RepID=A0ABW3Y0L9_9FLAO
MDHVKEIELKLIQFIRKFHVNEIIKGVILFTALGLLYFLLTLVLEYYLWLQPRFRSILFWSFIVVELILLTYYVLIPLFKLFGFRNGISKEEASSIIGKHFDEIDDKLLNIIQLKNQEPTELVLASIEQKALQLKPFTFKNAINFASNKVYLKFLGVPVLVFFIANLIGEKQLFSSSLNRVVHYNKAYEPPAPFYFELKDTKLEVIQGNDLKVLIQPIGDLIPNQLTISFEGQSSLMKNEGTSFSYLFENIDHSFSFYTEANGVKSENFEITLIEAPSIIDFSLELVFPDYLKRSIEQINNTGNITVPEGTNVIWKIRTKSTDEITFKSDVETEFDKVKPNYFEFKRIIRNDLKYQVFSSNKNLKAYEKLSFEIDVVKDEFPVIEVKSDIDSISRGDAHFLGLITDDYGISTLEFWYKRLNDSIYTKRNLTIRSDVLIEFFHSFPEDIVLEPKENYELFFVAYDNDGVNGKKLSRSNIFYYRQKSEEEVQRELYKEQQGNIDLFKSNNERIKDLNDDLNNLNKSLQSEEGLNWNKEKELEKYLEKQTKQQELLNKNADQLKKDLDGIKENGFLEDEKEEIKKRLEEVSESEKKRKLLEDLKKLAEKLNKEGLLDQMDKLNKLNEQQEKSLERILEMTKQFYVDRKMDQIQKSLDNLEKEQGDLLNNGQDYEKQKEINEKFEEIKKETESLKDQNNELKNPRNIPIEEKEMNEISEDLKNALDKLENNSGAAKENQKKAQRKMKEISEKMKAGMDGMQMERIEENIEDLERILNNLLIFSYDQEDLMNGFKSSEALRSDFPEKIKKQYVLKENFEHIDDSLYALSLRVVQISSKIQENLSEAHYNLDKSLENLAENRINQGISNQQYTMTAANDLADLLSNVLDNLQQQSQSQGSGKSKSGESISLPDIIKKQEELLNRMNNNMPTKDGNGENESESLSGEQFEIYREQVKLRRQLEKILKEKGLNQNSYNKTKSDMDKLEDLLLNKGLNNEAKRQMEILKYELLKLESAAAKQGEENNRESTENETLFNNGKEGSMIEFKKFNITEEFLMRRNLPLQPFYQEKVNNYFNNVKND